MKADRPGRLHRFAMALGGCLALWWALTGGDPGSWMLGVPVAVAAAAAVFLLPPGPGYRIRPFGAVAFAGYFLLQSVLGGVDVARRALAPRLHLDPGFVQYSVALPPGPARTFFMAVIGLLPGTLSVGVRGARIRVHVLDRGQDVPTQLLRLERRVAALYGLVPPGGAG
ncbi:Na+/H+ antiporter subunit E [Ectothiorhodospira mobilis]|uniref:Na+/H+ antiporter subunit E n=1 Tax=Ectothiorhodospira mobilis TaxID=195064 RepID=UPI001D97BB27|nr:Na+/H+ antiporter subunit E [Ectothiorhodospira mobilis]MBK1692939.1 hypothetical protein [Ectothiorhodospira mobilis]